MRGWLVCCMLLAPALPAQRTWIVDANNGAGTDFTDIPLAVKAAADGDVILVRSGTYSPFRILGKGLRVVAQLGAGPIVPRAGRSTAIRGLTATQAVVLQGLWFGVDESSSLRIEDCAGRVHLEALNIATYDHHAMVTGVALENAALVTVAHCTVTSCLVEAESSRLAISDSQLRGWCGGVALSLISWPPSPSLVLRSSTAVVSASFRGGDGILLAGTSRPPAPGIRAISSDLTVTGDDATSIQAGLDPGFTGVPVPAVAGSMGLTTVDPTARLLPINGAPPVSGPVQVRRVTGLRARLAFGDVLSGEVISPTGDVVVLIAGAPTLPLTTVIGDLFVQDWLVPVAGVQDSRGHLAFQVPLPVLQSLQHAPIALQAVNLSGATGLLELSNPVVLTVNRR